MVVDGTEVEAVAISDECKRCGGEMPHDGSALDLLGYCEGCGEAVQREYLARAKPKRAA